MLGGGGYHCEIRAGLTRGEHHLSAIVWGERFETAASDFFFKAWKLLIRFLDCVPGRPLEEGCRWLALNNFNITWIYNVCVCLCVFLSRIVIWDVQQYCMLLLYDLP